VPVLSRLKVGIAIINQFELIPDSYRLDWIEFGQ